MRAEDEELSQCLNNTIPDPGAGRLGFDARKEKVAGLFIVVWWFHV